jgi:hypothetical protein
MRAAAASSSSTALGIGDRRKGQCGQYEESQEDRESERSSHEDLRRHGGRLIATVPSNIVLLRLGRHSPAIFRRI